MSIRKSLLGVAAAGLAFGSTAAAAAPVALDRSGSEIGATDGVSGNGVGTFGLLLGLLIVAGLLAVVLSDDDPDSLPASP